MRRRRASTGIRRIRFRRLQAIQEICDFIFDFLGRGDGVGDFLAQKVAIAAAKAVGGGFESAFRSVERLGEGGVAFGRFAGGKERFERGEEL